MLNKRRRGKTLHSEAWEVTASIVKLCDEEAKQQQLIFPLACATQRAATYTGMSTPLIKRIRHQAKDRDKKGTLSPLHTPEKHQCRPNNRNITTDDFDMSVIRHTVQDYITKKKVPTCQHVKALEQEYWERDGVVADMTDAITLENPNHSRGDKEISCEHADSEKSTDFSDSELA
jgi:hypothetical protein